MAIYHLKSSYDAKRAIERLKYCIKQGFRVELRRILPKASRPQKNYVELIIDAVAMETGYTRDYVKYELFKRRYNPDIFVYDRKNPVTGEITKELRSINDPDSAEMTKAIERFRNGMAADYEGMYIPAPNEREELEMIETMASNYNYF